MSWSVAPWTTVFRWFHRDLVYFHRKVIACDVNVVLNWVSLAILKYRATAAFHLLLRRPINMRYQPMECYCSVNTIVNKMSGPLKELTVRARTVCCSELWLCIHIVIPYVITSITLGGAFIVMKSLWSVKRALLLVSVGPWEGQERMCVSVSSDSWQLGQSGYVP